MGYGRVERRDCDEKSEASCPWCRSTYVVDLLVAVRVKEDAQPLVAVLAAEDVTFSGGCP